MLCGPPTDSLAPELPAGSLQSAPHQRHYCLLIEAISRLDCLEGHVIFPGHADNMGHLFVGKAVIVLNVHGKEEEILNENEREVRRGKTILIAGGPRIDGKWKRL